MLLVHLQPIQQNLTQRKTFDISCTIIIKYFRLRNHTADKKGIQWRRTMQENRSHYYAKAIFPKIHSITA